MSKPSSPFGLSLLANHFPALHGARVLAILSVIQIHVSFELGARGWVPVDYAWLYHLSQRIWFGMDLFFFLSGFLIGTILLLPGSEGPSGVLRFYARRSFRIIPLYYVVLTFLALTTPLDATQKAQLWREYAYLTNYSDVGHVVMVWAWSLCVEEHFYLLVPLIVAGLKRLPSHRSRIAVLATIWGSGVFARYLAARSVPHDKPSEGFARVYIPSHTRYDILIAGVLLAYLWHHERARIEAWMAKLGVRVGSLVLTVVVFGSLLVVPGDALGGWWGGLAIGTVTGVGYLNLVVYLITTKGPLVRVLGQRAFLMSATLGYGVYLVHMPLVRTLGMSTFVKLRLFNQMSFPASFALSVLLVFGVSLAIGYVLHLLVEKPALFARDKLVPAKAASR